MRIIAGKYKGKKLVEFDLNTTRPTSDMIREALFDKIGFKVVDANFLDLFSGTGACGIEALSRNANQVFFVDSNREAIKIINKNLQNINTQNVVVQQSDFATAIRTFAKKNLQFDIVFLDPPYMSNYAENAIELLIQNNLLVDDFLLVWEHDNCKNEYILNKFPAAITKKYGDKFLTYFVKDDLIVK